VKNPKIVPVQVVRITVVLQKHVVNISIIMVMELVMKHIVVVLIPDILVKPALRNNSAISISVL